MDLITDSKDERLEFDTLCPECGPRPLLYEDGCCKTCGSVAQGQGVDIVMQSIRAALSRAEAAEKERDEARGRECRVKELIGKSMPNVSYWMKPKSYAVWNGNWIISAGLMRDINAALSSSSSPCPHEEEAKRLREAVEWACENVPDQLMECFYLPVMGPGEGGFRTRGWSGKGFKENLRRRAALKAVGEKVDK